MALPFKLTLFIIRARCTFNAVAATTTHAHSLRYTATASFARVPPSCRLNRCFIAWLVPSEVFRSLDLLNSRHSEGRYFRVVNLALQKAHFKGKFFTGVVTTSSSLFICADPSVATGGPNHRTHSRTLPRACAPRSTFPNIYCVNLCVSHPSSCAHRADGVA